MEDMDKIGKLPKWAQEHITRQRRDIERLTTQRDETFAAVNGGKESSLYVSGHNMQPNLYLPEDRQVVFKVNEKQEFTVAFAFVRDHFEKDRIVVRTGWGQMKIRPYCSNIVEISEEK